MWGYDTDFPITDYGEEDHHALPSSVSVVTVDGHVRDAVVRGC